MGRTRFLRRFCYHVEKYPGQSRKKRRVRRIIHSVIDDDLQPISATSRAQNNIKHLLDLIAQFPLVNPSASEPSELDIPKLFRQIRSRYKVLCATLGTKPTIRAAASQDEASDSSGVPQETKNSVWQIDSPAQPSRGDALSF